MAPAARAKTAEGRAELLDRKRRLLSDYLAAGGCLLQCLAVTNPDEIPGVEELAPHLDRRERVLADIRRIDKLLADAPPNQDPASEIVAESALRRALEAAADTDRLVGEAFSDWQLRLAAAMADLGAGRKTLRGYRTATSSEAHTRTPHNMVDEAA